MIVVEINEHVAALLLPGFDAPRPFGQRIRAIMSLITAAGSVAADIDEGGGPLPWCRRVVMVGQAERDVPLGEESQDARLVPARVAEFEAVATLLREQLEERRQPVSVGLELRRQLKQDRSDLVAEQ